jgi:hypothetical protein
VLEIADADPQRSALQRARRSGRSGDFGGWLGGQIQFQFRQQEAELEFGLDIAGEQQLATVKKRQLFPQQQTPLLTTGHCVR